MTDLIQMFGGTQAPVPATGYEFTTKETILRIKDLNVSFGDKVVIQGLNADVVNIIRPGHTQGQVIALLGPSGMGKTQLFNCTAGIQIPTAGEILINVSGVEGEFIPVRPGQVGVVAQHYPLFKHLTVIDNLMVSATVKIKDRAKARAACMDYLEKFGLEALVNQYPKELSGGQRQRIAIIQQMVSCGHLLLMDEPFSGLDIKAKNNVQRLITAVAAQDELNTVIITTHDIQAAIEVADTILLMGHARDPQSGAMIPGAKIVHTYDLASMGLAWRENISTLPQFKVLEDEIKARFYEL